MNTQSLSPRPSVNGTASEVLLTELSFLHNLSFKLYEFQQDAGKEAADIFLISLTPKPTPLCMQE